MSGGRREEPLLDEIRLRRALRLEAAELPPRIDLAAILTRAETDRPAFAIASLGSTLLAGVAAASLIGIVGVAWPSVAPALASDLFAAAIETLTRIAVPVSTLLSLAEQPSVPVAAIAALAVAIAYEYQQRRERVREVTS